MNIGDKVICKLYNSIDRKYYDSWVGTILEYSMLNQQGKFYRPYLVSREGYPNIWLSGKEVFPLDKSAT
jgi:hypothetical protein